MTARAQFSVEHGVRLSLRCSHFPPLSRYIFLFTVLSVLTIYFSYFISFQESNADERTRKILRLIRIQSISMYIVQLYKTSAAILNFMLCHSNQKRKREREKGRKRTFYKLRIERPAIVTATFIHIGPNSWIEISKQGKIANINRMESNNQKKRNFLRNVKLALRFCSLFLFFVRSISFCCFLLLASNSILPFILSPIILLRD